MPTALQSRRRPVSLPYALLRHRRLVIGVPVAVLVTFIAAMLIEGPLYTAQSSFTPEQSDNVPSRFAGIAAQFGIPVSGTSLGNPVRFYADLLTSRDLLRDAVLTKYHIGADTMPGPGHAADLISLYRIRGNSDNDRLDRAIRRLGKDVSVGTYLDAGEVRLSTSASSPELAEQLNHRLLELVSEFNLQRRQTRAAAERQFVEGRLTVTRAELTTAENALRRFLDENRQYQNSSQLRFEEARLRREVDLRQQVYTSLAQSYEQARIDEVRNTPVITVIAHPEGTARPARHIALDGLVWLLLGLGAAITLALLRELLPQYRQEHPELFEELHRLWGARSPTTIPSRGPVSPEPEPPHSSPRSVSARVE
ncbi:MAG: hypothetical protein AUI63_03550 [Gemmatimonadetes bacterium 13_1_40CM_2_60_3]|nr:MAG: hypothetical protein AUI63_03550 [Gemmatimonadetes bacterium 13_1_40CM_2_60_3]